ncbi:MAG: ABC transporter permease [Caldilineaceae bacterium]
MLSTRWRKVARDLWHNKTRTVLVVLSIAIGVFAVGMILHTALLVSSQVKEDYVRSRASNIVVYASGLNDDMIQAIRNVDGVADAAGRSSLTVRIKTADDQWNALTVRTMPDMEEIRIDRVLPVTSFDAAPEVHAERGTWPPGDHEAVAERSSFLMPNMMPAGIAVGDTFLVQTNSGRERTLTLTGLAHEPNTTPATFMGQGIVYVDQETFEWLGGGTSYDQVSIVVAPGPDGAASDNATMLAVANEVEAKIERSGRSVFYKEINEPGKSPRDSILQGITALMFPMGLLSLLLSGFLVVNTINALMSQHVRQIGIMKAVGARNSQITRMYMMLVVIFGVLALLVAVPLAALATSRTALLLAGFLNTTFPAYSLPPAVLGVELVIGLIVPLIAASWPVLKGTRITVAEALSDYGVGKGRFGRSLFDRILSHVHMLSRPTLVSLRNTFRRRGRLILTLFTLVLGGAIFIAVVNVRTSLTQTLDDALQYWKYDVAIGFNRAYRLDQIEQIAFSVPGVEAVESWDFSGLRRVRPDNTESDSIFVAAAAPDQDAGADVDRRALAAAPRRERHRHQPGSAQERAGLGRGQDHDPEGRRPRHRLGDRGRGARHRQRGLSLRAVRVLHPHCGQRGPSQPGADRHRGSRRRDGGCFEQGTGGRLRKRGHSGHPDADSCVDS